MNYILGSKKYSIKILKNLETEGEFSTKVAINDTNNLKKEFHVINK